MTGVRRTSLCVFGALSILAAGAASGAPRQVAYCPLTGGAASTSWAFHAGTPVQGAAGSYAHGNGTLTGRAATGHICQVDRAHTSVADRQIQIAPHGGANLQRGITINGVRGAELALAVRVTTSSDNRCRVGTRGTVTLFSSYNGARQDFAQFSFAGACADHNHDYSGATVAVSLPS
jgi:hypothetical protein